MDAGAPEKSTVLGMIVGRNLPYLPEIWLENGGMIVASPNRQPGTTSAGGQALPGH
jgi:hypothetical protein